MRSKINASARRALKGVFLASAPLIFACAAFADIGPPSPPLRLKSDYFGYAASVSPRVGYTDNIDLAPDGLKEGSFNFSTLFSGAAIYSTPRVTGIMNGDLDLSYLTEGSDFAVNQNVGAAATATVADNLFYVDLAGSTSRQLLGENARFSQNINAARRQRANVHTISASPYLFHEFADESSAQLRYRYSRAFIDDSRAGANPFRSDFLNDSQTQELVAVYDSGSAFDRLRFTGTAYGSKTVEDGSVIFPRLESRQKFVSGEMQFALSSHFALSGAVGYDDIDTDVAVAFFDDDALSGFFWRAGFYATPGPRTTLRVEYGRRYDDDFVDASLSYEISKRFTLRAGAGQSFETRAQTYNARFFENERATLDFADRLREGEALSPEGVIAAANRFDDLGIYAQSTGIGVGKRAYAQLQGAWERTELYASAYYDNVDYGFRETKMLTASVNAERRLSRRLSAYGGLFYRRSETTLDQAVCLTSPFLFGFDVNEPLFDPVDACLDYAFENGLTNTIGGRVGASYRLYENVSAFGEFAHTNRFADSALLEYGENAGIIGVTLEF
ncbi:MAG: hypothetical protein AB7P23_02665 [Amphiplicatus sp.]